MHSVYYLSRAVTEEYKQKHQLAGVAFPELVSLILAGEAKKYASFLPDVV